jgi:hypothetical protein
MDTVDDLPRAHVKRIVKAKLAELQVGAMLHARTYTTLVVRCSQEPVRDTSFRTGLLGNRRWSAGNERRGTIRAPCGRPVESSSPSRAVPSQ